MTSARSPTGCACLAAFRARAVFEVGLNAKLDQLSDAIDVVVYAEFADEAALQAWKSHPLYAEAIRVVRPLRELRHSADFVSGVGPLALRYRQIKGGASLSSR